MTASLVALIAATVVFRFSPAGHTTSAGATEIPPSTYARWIINGKSLAHLREHNAGLARRMFDNPRNYVVVWSEGATSTLPTGWRAQPAAIYASETAFAADIDAGRIPATVTAVIYDPEAWSKTPATEQANPMAAMLRFVDVARHAGYRAILAPARDLTHVKASTCARQPAESTDAAYVRCGFALNAPRADFFVVQAAADETQPEALRALLAGVRQQLGATTPPSNTFVTLSTAPPSTSDRIWPATLVRAVRADLPYAHNLVFNFSPTTTPLAASFLRHLERLRVVDGIILTAE